MDWTIDKKPSRKGVNSHGAIATASSSSSSSLSFLAKEEKVGERKFQNQSGE